MTRPEALNIIRPLPLTVDDFLLLDANGAFQGYGKTELIEGAVVFMNAQHRPHARIKVALYDALRDALRRSGSPLSLLIEATVAMPPHNAPEPDLIVTSEPDGEGPVPISSVALLVEIADTTLDNDLGTKARIYAANGVPEYWVVDVRGRIIHQHWAADAAGYTHHVTHRFADPLPAQTLAGLTVSTADLG